ncbi:MAG: DUF3426 domain-containing protein [Pseudomonadota bacterium]
MLTRCPHCETAFRVTSEQLKVRHGQVRCGACQRVFNALDSLADETRLGGQALASVTEPVTLPEEESAPPVLPETELLPEQAPEQELAAEPEPEPEPELEPESEPEFEPEQEPQAESQSPQDGEATAEVGVPTVPGDSGVPAEAVEPELPEEWLVATEEPPRRWPWALGLLFLLMLTLLQSLYYFRVELAVMLPELRPALAAACEQIGCTVPYPRRPELASIETSDLAPAGRDRLLLTATLRNRAPFAQEYPHLELTLTDTRDEPLLRKVLAPADWLPAEQRATAGFPARGEAAVNLLLEAPGVPAVGYRLYLFYP